MIHVDQHTRTWTTTQLLARADAQNVTISMDVSFRRSMHFRAVPLSALLDGAHPDDTLQLIASDGFAATLPAATLRNGKGAKAWLAIEDPAHSWPPLPGKKGDAGPFYVVWTHPAHAHISTEQWPYRVVRIQTITDVAQRFPATAPAASLAQDSDVQRGYAVFQRTCFACHTLNGEGDARLGPDLNVPYSPTDYLSDALLRTFIRNPQSLRRWPEGKMQGFPTQQALPDAELDEVIAYLHYMAKHKVPQ